MKLHDYIDVQKAGYLLKDSNELTAVALDFALANYGTIQNGILVVGGTKYPLSRRTGPVTYDHTSELARRLKAIKAGACKEKAAMRGNPFFDTWIGGEWYEKFS